MAISLLIYSRNQEEERDSDKNLIKLRQNDKNWLDTADKAENVEKINQNLQKRAESWTIKVQIFRNCRIVQKTVWTLNFR